MASMQPLSAFQKKDCLYCTNEATQEAFGQNDSGSRMATIRCCDNTDCVKKACDLVERSIGNTVSH